MRSSLAMFAGTLGLLMLPPAWAGAMPGLALDATPMNVQPTDSTFVAVDYVGDGTTVEVLGEVQFDASLFSSVTISCGRSPSARYSVDCDDARDGRIRFRARSADSDPLPAGFNILRMALTIAPTAPFGTFTVDADDVVFLDASGGQVTGVPSNPAVISVMQPPRAPGVSAAVGNSGDALIFPYFTALGDRTTQFVIQNTSSTAKAIRVTLREGAGGDELLSETFGPRITRAFNLYLLPKERAGFRISSNETTGTTRLTGLGCTLPRIPIQGLVLGMGSGSNAKGDTPFGEEGFITALVMADLDSIAARELEMNGCNDLLSRFGGGGEWENDGSANTVGPVGTIAGAYAVRGLQGLRSYEDGAVALRGFSGGAAHRPPWLDFTLNDGQKFARRGGMVLEFEFGAEAVSAALLEAEELLQVRSQGTEWVFSQPTKWLLTDPVRGVTTSPPLPPYAEAFMLPDGSCSRVDIAPLQLGISRDFCFSVATVPFDGRSLFESKYAVPGVGSTADVRALVRYDGTGLLDVDETMSLAGLPVIARAIPYQAGVTRRLSAVPVAAATPTPLPKGQDDGNETGASVAINGRLIFVGAPGANDGRGAVFVFRRHGTRLVFEATLEIPPEFDVAGFGRALAADGLEVVVGAPDDPLPAGKGNGGTATMQAAVWERANAQWNLKTPITTTDDHDDGFGSAVAIEGNVVAVGSPGDDAMGSNAGAVYVYEGANLVNVAQPMDPGQVGQFGASVALKNGIMGVGAPLAGVLGQTAGSVSMYNDITGNLSQMAVLTDDDPANGDGFGSQLAFNGVQLAIGAPGANAGADDEIDNAGQAQVWEFDGGGFSVANLLSPPDAGVNGGYGSQLSLTPLGGLVVGAPGALGTAGTGAIYEYSMLAEQLLLDARTGPEDDTIEGFGSALAADGEVVIIGAPQTAEEAGAALTVIDAEVLFFDDYETKLIN